MIELRFRDEYSKKIKSGEQAFSRIFERSFKRNYEPIGIDGYNLAQEKMLLAALGVCVNPDILRQSHCTHRAVAACIGLYFNSFPDELIVDVFKNMPTGFAVHKVGDGNDAARIFMAYGYNNWFGDNDNNLNCKVIPGAPNEVSPESLTHLHSRPMNGPQDFDNACPKRTEGAICNIQHAEARVIETTLRTFQNLGIPAADKTVLACTWVPCPECTNKIRTQREVYGENIDVFSVFAAQEDVDDDRMAAEIRTMLNPNGRNHLYGPYIKVPKNPGYGWYPVMDGTTDVVKELVQKKGAIDRRLNNILYRAFELSEV